MVGSEAGVSEKQKPAAEQTLYMLGFFKPYFKFVSTQFIFYQFNLKL